MPTPEPITNISDPRWVRAISHPLRIRLLAMLDEEPASPVILASKLEQPLGTIAYHVRTLDALGRLKLVSTRQRRGATEHYYKTTAHPKFSDDAWEDLDTVSKQRVLTATLNRAYDHATRSAAAGGFDASDAHFSSSSLKLDKKGWTALARESKKWLEKATQIEQEAKKRIESGASTAEDGAKDVGLTVLLFEALPFSSPEPKDDAAEATKPAKKAAAKSTGRRKQTA
jgi:DNA-binding transcriptional ArsR family regulator